MELGNIKAVSIVDQMTGAYLDYSMSVIVSRALPDVRDGLKPVHRRVLYAMDQMGLQSTKQFRKCAMISPKTPAPTLPSTIASQKFPPAFAVLRAMKPPIINRAP